MDMNYEIKQVHLSRIHFDIIHRMGSLLFMFCATTEKIEESSETIQWYKKGDSRGDNKYRMKETGRMLNGYRDNLEELMIIGISKAVEDLIFEYDDTFDVKVNFWESLKRFEFYHEMKIIRNLNNCIKHSKGILKRGEKGNDYLIDEIGFIEDEKVKNLHIDIVDYLLKSFLFQMDIYWKSQQKDNPFLKYKNNSDKLKEILIPDFINDKKPRE